MNGAFNEMANFNGMAALETPEFLLRKMDELGSPSSYNHYSVGWAWAMDTPFQWTKQVASHWGGTRNGTIVHWPERDRGARRAALAVHPRDRRRARRSSRPPGCPSRRWSTACSSRRWRARACCTPSTTPTPPERHDLQYFEMFGNRGIYHRGWSAVTKHRTPVGDGRRRPAGVRRRRLGALRRQQRLQPGPRPRRRAPRDAGQAAAALADRGHQVQRAAHGRPRRRAARAGDGRPPDPDPRELAAVLPRHGTPVGEQRGQHQEQVVLGHRRGRRPRRRRRGRDHRPGRPVRRLGALRQGRQGQVRLQRARHPRVRHRGRRRRSRPAPTRCGWSSPTTAAAWPRAATSPSTTTAPRSAPAASRPPSR